MYTTRRQCSICGKVISERFFVCMRCLQEYNLPFRYKDYPLWLKHLIRIDARDLRLRRKEIDHLSLEMLDAGFYNSKPENTRRF